MKITAETADQLSAIDHNYTQLIVSPVLALIGLGVIGVGVGGRQVTVAVFGLIFLAIGAVLLVTRKTRTLTISKSSGTLSLVAKGIAGGKSYSCNLQDVLKIQLLSEYRTQYNRGQGAGEGGFGMNPGNTNTQHITHLNVLERDGTSMSIAQGSRSMGTAGIISKVPNQEVGERIAQFIGVPFEVVGPNMPTLGSVVAGVEQMMHHNDTAPSVVPAAPAAPATPPQPTPPPASPGPDAPGFAMPHDPPGEAVDSQDSQPPATPPAV